MDPRFTRLLEKMRLEIDSSDPGHDLTHVMRVLRAATHLAREVGADLAIVQPAALLHDVVNVPKNHPDRAQASRMAAEKARGILAEFGYSPDEIERISLAIIEHSFSAGLKPSTLESAVVQDADRLDALGAIGCFRTASVGVKMGTSYYDPSDLFAERRALDDKRFTLDHFAVKLFRLPEMMNTVPGRREAERRAQFMREFVEQLSREAEFSPSRVSLG